MKILGEPFIPPAWKTRRCFGLFLVLIATLNWMPLSAAPSPARPPKPNILLVMADQLAPFQTGPYGNREVKTPHLDRLAREGITFTAAYSSSPLCVPARAALMSGR